MQIDAWASQSNYKNANSSDDSSDSDGEVQPNGNQIAEQVVDLHFEGRQASIVDVILTEFSFDCFIVYLDVC